MRDDQFSIDIPKRWLRRAVMALALGMLVLPVAAWAGHQFDDVPDSNAFHDDIDWMADTGITRGCNPPDNDEYCPGENVKREQMAAFMHRMDTEDVFVTPEELDSTVDFAAIDDDGSVFAENGLDSSTRDGTGMYTLVFTDDIDECSWTGTVGGRGGTTLMNYNLTLNYDADDAIDVRVWDGNTRRLADAPFDVTINC